MPGALVLFLEMDEGARELDKASKELICGAALTEP
jgi:hypothetical protein